MLTVREAQVEALRDAVRERYEADMLTYLRQAHPLCHAELGDTRALALVRKGLDLCRSHGMPQVGSTSVVIDLMARFGERFERSGAAPWIDAMLARHELPPEVRIESIIGHLIAKTGGRSVAPGPVVG